MATLKVYNELKQLTTVRTRLQTPGLHAILLDTKWCYALETINLTCFTVHCSSCMAHLQIGFVNVPYKNCSLTVKN